MEDFPKSNVCLRTNLWVHLVLAWSLLFGGLMLSLKTHVLQFIPYSSFSRPVHLLQYRLLPLLCPVAALPLCFSLSSLLFTSLFHTFCLAFKSPFFPSTTDLPAVKNVDMESQAKGLVSFLEPVTVHRSPRRNYCWNKQLWEVSALVDPSLLTISQPLSAIAKTLSHRRAVMIALLSCGRNKKKEKKKRGWSEKESGVQFEVFHKREGKVVPYSRPSKRKCFKLEAAQTCQTTISVTMVTWHS